MKKIFIIMCCMAFLIIWTSASAREQGVVPVGIKLNGKFIKTEEEAYLKNGVTMVPVRVISEGLRCDDISWNDKEKKVTLKKDENNVILTIGSKNAIINGENVAMQESAKIINGRTFVPVRTAAEAMGADVEWDNRFYNVNIKDENTEVLPHIVDYDMSEDKVFWLARIIEAESGGEPEAGQIAVGNVVLNRVKSKDYPNTVYGVIFDKTHGVQFQPVINGSIYNTPSRKSIISAKKALLGENYAGDSLFFLNPLTAESKWIVNNRTFFATINNHDFYL